MRRVLGAVVVLAAVALVGCSGDGDADKDEADPTTTTTFGEKVSDEEFADIVGELDDAVAASGTDFCALVAASEFAPTAMPSTPAQVESAVAALAGLYRAIAASGALEPADSATVEQFADEYEQRAAAAEYSVDFITGKESSELAESSEFAPALAAVDERATADCAPADGATTTSPTTDPTTTAPTDQETPA